MFTGRFLLILRFFIFLVSSKGDAVGSSMVQLWASWVGAVVWFCWFILFAGRGRVFVMLFGGCLGSGRALLCPLGSVCFFCLSCVCVLFVGFVGMFWGRLCGFVWSVLCILCVVLACAWSLGGWLHFGFFYLSVLYFTLLGLSFSTQVCYSGYFVTRFTGYMGGHLYLQAVPSLPRFNRGRIAPGGGRGSRSPPVHHFW